MRLIEYGAMFSLYVDVFDSQCMEQELLTGDGVFEAVEQSTPAEIVGRYLVATPWKRPIQFFRRLS